MTINSLTLPSLTGQEEQIGGFDLICKGTPVKNESSLFSTMLGCHNNRSQQLKKLSKIISSKLSQTYHQEKEDAKKASSAKERDVASTAASDTSLNTAKAKVKATSKVAAIYGGAKNTTRPPTLIKQAAGSTSATSTATVGQAKEAKEVTTGPNLKAVKSKVKEAIKPKGLPTPPVSATSATTMASANSTDKEATISVYTGIAKSPGQRVSLSGASSNQNSTVTSPGLGRQSDKLPALNTGKGTMRGELNSQGDANGSQRKVLKPGQAQLDQRQALNNAVGQKRTSAVLGAQGVKSPLLKGRAETNETRKSTTNSNSNSHSREIDREERKYKEEEDSEEEEDEDEDDEEDEDEDEDEEEEEDDDDEEEAVERGKKPQKSNQSEGSNQPNRQEEYE